MTSFLARDKEFLVVEALDLLRLGGLYRVDELMGLEEDGFAVVTFLALELDAYAFQPARPRNAAMKTSS